MAKLLFKFLFSRKALEELYARRRALNPSEHNRSLATVLACSALFLLIMSFLMAMSWSRRNIAAFLDSQPTIKTLEQSQWQWSPATQLSCYGENECLAQISRLARQEGSLKSMPDFGSSKDNIPWVSLLATTVSLDPTELFFSDRNLTFVLPALRYHKAHVFLNRKLVGIFNSSERMAIRYDRVMEGRFASSNLQFDILVQTPSDAMSFLPPNFQSLHKFDQSISYMPSKVFGRYRQYSAADAAGRGDFIGYIARIVMAVFVLALFLLVDGSPETLGLGLFMGFEAFAMSMSFEWFETPYSEWLRHYCYQMGDLFRLFFFLQLARVIDKKVTWWLIYATLLSVPYGYIRQFQLELGWDWPSEIPKYRDITVGIVGMAVCFRTAAYLLDKQLPWRVIALTVAGIASIEQFVDPLASLIPFLADSTLTQRYVDIFQPLSAYLLAFSAFINISTLENRVKSLSKIEAQHQEIRHEMELGKTVQKAFLHIPELPPKIGFVTHHEAMMYVSGDTFFVDWDQRNDNLTFFINDVTGHGVQAALKASGVNVIASTLWLKDKNSNKSEKIIEYCQLVRKFFQRMNQNPDVLALGAAQVNFKNGVASLYRVNFPFPIIIEPKTHHIAGESSRQGDNWRIRLLATKNETLTHYQLSRGSFIIIFSDGFIDTSRSTNEFLNYLRRHIGRADYTITCEDIKQLIVDCPIRASNTDDRTMNIFQWTLDEAARTEIADERDQKPLDNNSLAA